MQMASENYRSSSKGCLPPFPSFQLGHKFIGLQDQMPLLSQHLKEKLRAENEIRNAQCPVGTNKEMRICFKNQSFE